MIPDDVAGRDPTDVYGAALAHLHLAAFRPPGTPRVRVYTPSFDDHGWDSAHSVVELVTDDMPFLLDSVTMELSRSGVGMHLVVHPVVEVVRDPAGHLLGLRAVDGGSQGTPEAFIHVEIDRLSGHSAAEELRESLVAVLVDVRAAVEDWAPMRARALALAVELESEPEESPDPLCPDLLRAGRMAEAGDFLRFVAEGGFVFLGSRDYELAEEGEQVLRPVSGSGLGVLREAGPTAPWRGFARVPPERQRRETEGPLILTRASLRSTVHRAGSLDYIGVLRHDSSGALVGEWRLLGLYTLAVHKGPTAGIPVVRRKVRAVLDRAGFPPASHNGKALVAVLEAYPRHEVLELSSDDLFETAMGILALEERRQVRLFARRDRFRRYWSCLVYVPLDRYTQAVRQRITEILLCAFAGSSFEYSAEVGESVLARLHFTVHAVPDDAVPDNAVPDEAVPEDAVPEDAVPEDAVPEDAALPDLELVEARLAEAARSWADDLSDALLESHDEDRAVRLLLRFADAFPSAYRDDFSARGAVADIGRIESLAGGIALSLSRPLEASDGLLRLKLFQVGRPVPLSAVLPLLEGMGVRVLDHRPYEVRPTVGDAVWIHDFGLAPEVGELDTDAVKEVFTEAFAAVWRGDAENDGFNRLVLGAGLTWREVAVLRAYGKYLRQIGSTFSQAYMESVLAANPHVARLLVELFHSRFDPARHPDPDDRASLLTKRLEGAIEALVTLDEDRIGRSFLGLVQATVRTNWFQDGADGQAKIHLSFKLDPAQIADLPLPRPRFEIFVCSPWLEGIHLRGGRVSRGGIRWSDRREDFRTEVLGLMKAQMVKNAVIVPVGAKGGFVVKRPPSDRDALAAEVAACYRAFVSGLLDLTDDLVAGKAGKVVSPPGLVVHDGDDPYLVVAADKGTATFSDLANSIAAERGYWLGDAFASGGSTGYDHKKIGITARGAWESVRRHFRELGVDVDESQITAVGVGDMSGDVFGNGMLLSRHLQLVAAFDHRHVFLDPDPDPEASFAERQRLFRLPRSSWADYRPEVISPGGGVFSRAAKSIPLPSEVRRALQVGELALAPTEVVRAILRAPVDLLWNGGIGTYVKAAGEAHADVGDKSNDAVRVNAGEVRAKVVAEGGNLGFTQRGRIEFALAGGRIHTDAIDNSAGVDCSDHEVNIKVLLDLVVGDGELTVKQRNRLLAEMEADVAALVLADNREQTAALRNARAQAPGMVGVHARYLKRLETEGALDRALEFLPSDEAMAQRRASGSGLTAPELAVLLAYTKTGIAAALLASDAPEDPWLSGELPAYFPPALRDGRFSEAMSRHPLRREIVATRLTNALVDRGGTTFVHRLTEETGAPVPELARAYAAAREIFGLDGVWAEVEALGHRVAAAVAVPVTVQTAMVLEVRRLAERATRWLVRHRPPPIDVSAEVAAMAPGVAEVVGLLGGLLSSADRRAMAQSGGEWVASGVPETLASKVAGCRFLVPALDVVEVAGTSERGLEEVAGVYFALGERLELDWLGKAIQALSRDDRWQVLARAALRDDHAGEWAALALDVLRAAPPGVSAFVAVDAWIDRHRSAVERFLLLLEDIRAGGAADLATLSVAMREVRGISRPASTAR